MTNSLQRLQALGQSVWFDNIRRGFIRSGELQRLVDLGVSGLTSNPSIFEKAITESSDYDWALLDLALAGNSATEIFESLAVEDIRDAADLLLPVYERTVGADGFASIEVSPLLANDTEGTVAEAQRLHATLQRPNVMIKVPATPAGIPAIRQLISDGINVNVTLIFSLDAYAEVREAYVSGLEELELAGGDPSRVSSVASFFVSRIDASVDGKLDQLIDSGIKELEGLMGKAAIANAKMAYRDFAQTFSNDRFAALATAGARVQRPLWASTSTKNPEYSDVLYVDELIGPNSVNTLPDVTLHAFLEHGNPRTTIDHDLDEAERTMQALEDAGISMSQITSKLLEDGVKAFAGSYDTLIANIEDKRARLVARQSGNSTRLGGYEESVTEILADLESRRVPRRIWDVDHTVWNPDPVDITDRLGWLTVAGDMRQYVEDMQAFAEEVKSDGFRHVVLLGMGGSSLGALALSDLFGSADGYPDLTVLDTTVPATISAISDSLDCEKTLFIVASKSGTTIEPNVLYKHFRALVEREIEGADTGNHFVAICDAGTSLERLAREDGFRRVFTNPPDLGGRYSVQSLFGLVPAALLGIDVGKLLDSVETMSTLCGATVPANDNPAVWLGALIASLVEQGRDKLTIVTTESLQNFALWVEQLLAESTGKEGKGIIPVANEPHYSPNDLGSDRLFVYVRLEEDDTDATDRYMKVVEEAGIPVVRFDLTGRHNIGAEFFRWEFATAVAGSLMGIHPFDQPNVQQAKDKTTELLADYENSGRAPALNAVSSLTELMSHVKKGDYLAITAFAEPTAQVELALADLRQNVTGKWGVATTLGYGPRYLHSTGQLHKGGADSGLSLQLTQIENADVTIPGEKFTFGVLAAAQAKGDLDALAAQGRHVARINLGADAVQTVKTLANSLK